MSPPSRGAWIEIVNPVYTGTDGTSPPSRGAWIEINVKTSMMPGRWSRPPRGGRGLKSNDPYLIIDLVKSPPSRGAWIEIGNCRNVLNFLQMSPPSRGAWIEILICPGQNADRLVAPLAGGVD